MRRRHAAALLGYTAIFSAFFAPVWSAGHLLAPGDGLIFWLPAFLRERTWWTPLIFAGFPIAAEPSLQTFYPLSWVCAQLDQWNAFIISAYVIGAAGMYAYVFALTRSTRASFVSGLVFSGSGFLFAHLGHASIIHAAAWIPVILWALEQLRQQRQPLWIIVAAAAVANAILSGHPQIWSYGLATAALYVAVLGWSAPSGRRWTYTWSCFALAVGVGLGAVQILPGIELIRQTVRDRLPFAQFTSYALPLREGLRHLFPALFGTVPGSFYGIPYFGTTTLTETAAYTGWLPIGLASIALRAPAHRLVTRFWLVTCVWVVLLAFGDATPVARVAHHLPLFGNFRCPGRALVLMTIGVATLAGIGMAALEHAGAAGRSAARYTGVLVLMLGAAGGLLLFGSHRVITAAATLAGHSDFSLLPWRNLTVAIPLAFACASAIAITLYGTRPSRTRALLLLFVAAADLASFTWTLEWRAHSPDRTALDPPPKLEPYRRLLADSHMRLMPQDILGPAASAAPNLSMLWGIPSARGLTSVPLRRLVDLAWLVPDPRWAPASRILDMLAVRYLLRPLDSGAVLDARTRTAAGEQPQWRYVENIDGVGVYENPNVMPRAWLVGNVTQLSADAVIDTLRRAQLPDGQAFDPAITAMVEDPIEFRPCTLVPSDRVTVEDVQDTRMRLNTHSAGPAFLVVSDTYYSGWRARIDGQPTPIHRTNYILRGIVVPAGSHVVEMVYQPASFYIGLAVSGASVMVLLWGTWRSRRSTT